MQYTLQIERKYSHLILGIAMRYARLKAGLSLRNLGEIANISHTLIANIENGKTVANPETLRQMFTILGLEFRDDQDLIDSYLPIYERVFHNLYYFHYDRTTEDIRFLRENEAFYANSIVSIDNTLLLGLHAALTDTMGVDERDKMVLLGRMLDLLSSRQKQLFHLIQGVDWYNQGRYLESFEMLEPATKLGDHQIDPLIRYYLIANQVHMYHFMDAQKNADIVIRAFEDQINYERAMLVRLEQGYSSIAGKRFDEARSMFERIQRYRDHYDTQALTAPLQGYRIYLAMMERDVDTLRQRLNEVDSENSFLSIARLTLGAMEQDHDRMREEYKSFCERYSDKPIPRDRDFVTGLMFVYGALDSDDATFVATFERIIARGKQTHDQGLLRFGYHYLIQHYKQKRKYKKALDLSEEARIIRSYGPSLAA
jgi:transcriptional regulator with XRE-family HTH domain